MILASMVISKCVCGFLESMVPLFSVCHLTLHDERDDFLVEGGEVSRRWTTVDDEAVDRQTPLEDFMPVLER